MKLEISYDLKKKTVKKTKQTNIWRLNNIPLNYQWITEQSKEEIKNYQEKIKVKAGGSKSMEHSKSSAKREVGSHTILPKIEKIISKNLTL